MFAYTNLVVAGFVGNGSVAHVSVTVTNTGSRGGREVVQLYVDLQRPGVSYKELRGFAKTPALAPGQDYVAVFTVAARDVSTWSPQQHAWVMVPGPVAVFVGSSSRDLRAHSTIKVLPHNEKMKRTMTKGKNTSKKKKQ